MSDKYSHWLPRLFARIKKVKVFAITISATCTLWSCLGKDRPTDLMRHERFHQLSIYDRQLRKGKYYGWIDWMATYLWRMITVGYSNSEEEKEARDYANRN